MWMRYPPRAAFLSATGLARRGFRCETDLPKSSPTRIDSCNDGLWSNRCRLQFSAVVPAAVSSRKFFHISRNHFLALRRQASILQPVCGVFVFWKFIRANRLDDGEHIIECLPRKILCALINNFAAGGRWIKIRHT